MYAWKELWKQPGRSTLHTRRKDGRTDLMELLNRRKVIISSLHCICLDVCCCCSHACIAGPHHLLACKSCGLKTPAVLRDDDEEKRGTRKANDRFFIFFGQQLSLSSGLRDFCILIGPHFPHPFWQQKNCQTHYIVIFCWLQRKSRRPPTFNPEDYVVFLRKVLSSTNANGGLCTAVEKLYGKDSQMSAEMRSKMSHSPVAGDRPNNNKQSSDVSDVLKKLRLDLFFSFARYTTRRCKCSTQKLTFVFQQLLQGICRGNVRRHRSPDGHVARHPNGPSRAQR